VDISFSFCCQWVVIPHKCANSHRKFSLTCHGVRDTITSGPYFRHFYFRYKATSGDIAVCTVEKLDLENLCVTVGILFLRPIQVDLHLFLASVIMASGPKVPYFYFRNNIWIFHFRFVPRGSFFRRNVQILTGISQLAVLGSDIQLLPVFPSAISISGRRRLPVTSLFAPLKSLTWKT